MTAALKICSECRQSLPLDDFHRNKSRSDGRAGYCRPCRAARDRAHRRSHLEEARAYESAYRRSHLEEARARRLAFRAKRRHFLQALKLTIGCVDCGYSDDPARLHFDHHDGEVKNFDPGHGANRGWPKLLAEIDKCDVRCVRCHAARHDRLRDTRSSEGHFMTQNPAVPPISGGGDRDRPSGEVGTVPVVASEMGGEVT